MAEERFNFKRDNAVTFPTAPTPESPKVQNIATILALLSGVLGKGRGRSEKVRRRLATIAQGRQTREAQKQTTFRNEMADAFRQAERATQKMNTQFNQQLDTLQERRRVLELARKVERQKDNDKQAAEQLKIENERDERALKIRESAEKRLAAATTMASGTAKAIDDAKALTAWRKYKDSFKNVQIGFKGLDFQVWKAKFWDKAPGLSETPDLNRINTLSKKKVDENGKEVTSPSLEFAHEISDDELLGLRNSDNPREKALGDSLFILLQTEQQNKQNAAIRDLTSSTKTTFRR